MRGAYQKRAIERGDVLIVRTTPEELVSIRKQSNLELHPVKLMARQRSASRRKKRTKMTTDRIFCPGGRGAAIRSGRSDAFRHRFRRRYGAIVVGSGAKTAGSTRKFKGEAARQRRAGARR